MPDMAPWLKELTNRLENDPLYVAEGMALNLAVEINKQLTALSMSRKEYANALGVSQARVSQILNGEKNLTLLSIAKAALAVGLIPSLPLLESSQTDPIALRNMSATASETATCVSIPTTVYSNVSSPLAVGPLRRSLKHPSIPFAQADGVSCYQEDVAV